MTGWTETALAVAVIAALILTAGGIRLIRDLQTRTRGVLMVVAALVIVMNVAILTL